MLITILKFYSSGKILLSGEYLVLDGAVGLGLPCNYGQYLEVLPGLDNTHKWISYNADGTIWFTAVFSINLQQIITTNDIEKAKTLQKLLQFISKNNQEVLQYSLTFTTTLDFDKDWGLGSSSTLINNLSQWSGVDAFSLLNHSFGGSGYDVAVARANAPILFTKQNAQVSWQQVVVDYPFADQLWFVYLNRKQNSREGIKAYKKTSVSVADIQAISAISKELVQVSHIDDFCRLLNAHDRILTRVLHRKTVQQTLFPDYKGCVKSLGAWGGDFVLAVGDNAPEYFASKGYKTIVAYKQFIKI